MERVILALLLLFGLGVSPRASAQTGRFPVGLAQGVMAGEVSEASVILQSRLTSTNPYTDKRWSGVIGSEGVACFELSVAPDFRQSFKTAWINAKPEYDYIIKTKVKELTPGTRYYYRLLYGPNKNNLRKSHTCTFRTHSGAKVADRVSMVLVTGMNYSTFHFIGRDYWGPFVPPYRGKDEALGYPALEAILRVKPDFFVGTGDNVYLDYPSLGRAETQQQFRKKYQEQFSQPRFIQLLAQVATYWEKDDHDYRFNDSDPVNPNRLDGNVGEEDYSKIKMDSRISGAGELPTHETAVRLFKEQMPVADPEDPQAVTYRTYRLNHLLQIWLVEGRDYRSPNDMPDGPGKSIWGTEQKEWLKRTLLESDATFKVLISPTCLIGPDGFNKRDNMANPKGFRYEREEFFRWLIANNLLQKGFCIVTGDRHWQYHSIDPSGFEEFCTGAVHLTNAAQGIYPGDPKSSDPEGKIKQPYHNAKPTGGFLLVVVKPEDANRASLEFRFHDDRGGVLYRNKKTAAMR